ncbi:retrovirus-related pol polyprotein from transposon TNT 1-94 [Tanacetum coccineum]
MDLFGPVSPKSVNHEKYTLVIVDEYSRMVENQNDIKVKQIRTNNGNEFRNSELERFYDEKRISQNFSSSYTPEQNGLVEKKSRTLIESQDIPHTESVEGLPDQENIKGTQEQVVQYEQINHQSTKESSVNNIKTSVQITESLVPETLQSQHASTSSYPFAQDRWSQNQHIKLVNIIGDPGEEPKKMSEELKHPGWVKAIQEELNQLYRNKVSTLVPLPQVARMEAIRIFIAFATYMNFIVFQMDVKSAFLNGKLKEEAYVKQPPGFKSTEFPDYVCKLDKALYGRKQSPRACSLVKTPMVPPNNSGPDLAGKPVNETLYRGMIGSLIYLKGTSSLGLYYPKCSGFDLKGYSDSDYAGCNMDKKRTSVLVKSLEENWFVGVLRNNSQWLCPQLRLITLLLLVWTLVPLPHGKIAIGSKWVSRNKKNEHEITTKNKGSLVAQGYSQEEEIDYDETFAPVTRMEAIKIFLVFTTYMNFIVYQMDVKSDFLNRKLKEEVYVKQPPGFKSSEFPD